MPPADGQREPEGGVPLGETTVFVSRDSNIVLLLPLHSLFTVIVSVLRNLSGSDVMSSALMYFRQPRGDTLAQELCHPERRFLGFSSTFSR